MQVYSHNVILYVCLFPQCTSGKLTHNHTYIYTHLPTGDTLWELVVVCTLRGYILWVQGDIVGVILCVCKNWTDILGVLYVLHCELKNIDRLYYTHNPHPLIPVLLFPILGVLPQCKFTPTMSCYTYIYSHNVPPVNSHPPTPNYLQETHCGE